MKAHKSPLILNEFFLLNLDYSFTSADEELVVKDLFDNYLLDIDFAFNEIEKNTFQLFTKISVNEGEESISGYKLFIEGVCIFSFNSSDLSEKDKLDLLHISGLNICINSLRNIIATTTSNGPFGKYILPSINVNLLLEGKRNQFREDK